MDNVDWTCVDSEKFDRGAKGLHSNKVGRRDVGLIDVSRGGHFDRICSQI